MPDLSTPGGHKARPLRPVVVNIVDFGIAKLRESATHTQTGTLLGTPAYMFILTDLGHTPGAVKVNSTECLWHPRLCERAMMVYTFSVHRVVYEHPKGQYSGSAAALTPPAGAGSVRR